MILKMVREAIQMNIRILKSRKILLYLSLAVTLFLGYQGFKTYSYFSLKNPFDEIYYSETNAFNWLNLPDFSKIIRSSVSYRGDKPRKLNFALKQLNLENDEELSLHVRRIPTMILEYKKDLGNNSFLFLTYKYKQGILQESVTIGFSKLSDEYVKLAIEEERSQTGEMSKKELYRYAGIDYPVRKSLTNPIEVLEYLKVYNINKFWLKKKAHEILYDDFLDIWFKKGSQRYSKDNLGDLKIEKAKIFEK